MFIQRILNFFRKPEPPTEESTPVQDTEAKPRRRRRPRRRRGSQENQNPAVEQTTEATSTPPASEEADSDGEDAPAKPRRRRRRRSRKPSEDGAASTGESGESLEADAAPPAISMEDWDPASFEVPPEEGKTRFQDLNLPPPVLRAIADLEFQYCTPIQATTLPQTLQGRDALGKAQTGTGKTAAFLITIFNRLLTHADEKEPRHGTPRALVLAPTRELVIQIGKDARALAKHTPLRVMTIYGGMDYAKQQRMLRERHVDVVIATPGRLLDFQSKHDVHLSRVEVLVIDEADRMLDMGFIPDVRNIVHSTPSKTHRQTLLFSATFTTEVKRLSANWTKDTLEVEIEAENKAADTVDQQVFIVTREQKFVLLVNLIRLKDLKRVMVFSNWRDEARRITDRLRDYGIEAALLSGEVPQAKRVSTLEKFRDGKIIALVATDVAGRGIHVEGVSHVVNYSLPQDPEDYVHRIGRTGRAGESGISVSFADEEDSFQIPAIQEYLERDLPCVHPEPELLAELPPKKPRARNPRGGSRGGRGGGRRNQDATAGQDAPAPSPSSPPQETASSQED